MSIFGDIWNKITSAAESVIPGASAEPQASETQLAAPKPAPSAASAQSAMSEVDVEVILAKMEAQKGGSESNWRTSIVDLLKLLDLDSSLDARKELANELNVHVGEAGTAEENIALHKAVMQKLEENGGKVPDSLKG